MLRYQTAGQVEPVSASEVRLRHAELAEALAVIQARREAEARADAETIRIGDALRELGLSVSAEEVLATVHSLQAAAVVRRKRRALRWYCALAALVLTLSTAGATLFLARQE